MSDKTKRLLGFTATQPSDMLITILLVPPPQLRSSVEYGPNKRAEDSLTHAYSRIVYLNKQIL